jgi:hypothetical protein
MLHYVHELLPLFFLASTKGVHRWKKKDVEIAMKN